MSSIIRRRGTVAAAILTGLIAITTVARDTQVVEAKPDEANAGVAATLKDQVDLAVTVYNSNIALVRDVRQIALPAGGFDLQFLDIAATVNPATVHFRSLTEPSKLGILEQNYQFDLLDPQRLLKKYVGRDVTLVRRRQENGTTTEETVKARLLAFNDAPVWRIGDEIVTGFMPEQYRFPEIPDNLHERPTLIWMLDNGGSRDHRIETSYLASNMTWNADYVLTVARDDQHADLDGWVTVSNTSGASYRNARLQLVAGDLHRVAEGMADAQMVMAKAAREMAASPAAFTREAFSEYHLYSLGRRTTLVENETKQISLLGGTGVPVKKLFVVEGQQFYYRNRQHPGSPLKDQVAVFYKLRTTRHLASACRCLPAPCASTRPTRKAACSSPERIASTTRRKTRMCFSGSARRSTSYASASRSTTRRLQTTCTRWRSRSRCAITRRRQSLYK
jgi:hypothetical protein